MGFFEPGFSHGDGGLGNAALMGAAIAILAVTGVLIWVRKRRAANVVRRDDVAGRDGGRRVVKKDGREGW